MPVPRTQNTKSSQKTKLDSRETNKKRLTAWGVNQVAVYAKGQAIPPPWSKEDQLVLKTALDSKNLEQLKTLMTKYPHAEVLVDKNTPLIHHMIINHWKEGLWEVFKKGKVLHTCVNEDKPNAFTPQSISGNALGLLSLALEHGFKEAIDLLYPKASVLEKENIGSLSVQTGLLDTLHALGAFNHLTLPACLDLQVQTFKRLSEFKKPFKKHYTSAPSSSVNGTREQKTLNSIEPLIHKVASKQAPSQEESNPTAPRVMDSLTHTLQEALIQSSAFKDLKVLQGVIETKCMTQKTYSQTSSKELSHSSNKKIKTTLTSNHLKATHVAQKKIPQNETNHKGLMVDTTPPLHCLHKS